MLFTLIKRFIEAVLLVLCLFMSGMLGAAAEAASLDYNDERNWAYWQEGKEKAVAKRLVACYAIGWRITDKELKDYPHLKMAQGPADIGVIISFNSESSTVQSSLMVPAGVKTKSINPLTWRTDNNYASALHNKGVCFTDYSANIKREQPYFCGACLDEARGTLKINNKITAQAYPPVLDIFAPGVFHLYDYQFFYRNLQDNVKLRTSAYWR